MTGGSLEQPVLPTSERQLSLLMQLSQSSLWEFALTDGSVENSYLEEGAVYWEMGRGSPAGTDFFSCMDALGVSAEDRLPLAGAIQACVDGQTPGFLFELRLRQADGSIRWHLTRGRVARDDAGRPTSFIGTSSDVTELKNAEQESRTARERIELARVEEEQRLATERLALATKLSNVFVWIFDLVDGALERAKVTFINIWESLGYEIAPRSLDAAASMALLILPEDLPLVVRAVQAALSGESPQFEVECRVRHKDGSVYWTLSRGLIMRDAAGMPLSFLGTSVDITQRKLLEDSLKESQFRWRSLTETLPLLIFTAAADGTIEYLGAQATGYTGRTEQEMLGAGWAESIHPDDLERTGKSWFAAIEGQHTHEVEHRIRRADGEYRWFSTRAAPARDSSGRVFKWVGTCTDITSSKQLEAELRHAKELLELGIRGSNVAIFDFDMPDGRIETARQTMINVWETLGYDAATAPSEFAPGAMLAIHSEDLARVQQEIGAYLAGLTPNFEAEYRVRHKDGSVLWRIARGTAFRDADGTPIRFMGSFFDITDIKRVEDKLRDSELRWRTLVETVPHLVFTTQADGEVDHFSAQTLAFLGRPEAELLGFAWREAIHPDDRAYVDEEWSKSIEQQLPHETHHRVRRSDGEYRWMTTRAIPLRDDVGRVLKWFGTSTDITAMKRLEAELRHAKDLLELGVRGSKVSIFEFDMPDGDLGNARQTMINLWESLGYDPATAPTRFGPGSELAIHPEDLERVRVEVDAYLSRARPDFDMEFRVRNKQGAVFWHLARGVAYRDTEGKPVRFIGSFVDITDKKQVEEQHRASEQRWRTLAETLPQLVWSATADGAADYFSVQAQEFTGLSEAELVGASWLSVIHPDDHASTIEAWTEALRTGCLYNVDFRVRRADGVYRWFGTRATPLRDGTGRIYKWVGACTDVEDGKQLAERLRESEQRWQQLAEMVPHFVWRGGADGSVDYYSAQATEYTGLPEKELHGFSWAQTLHPADREYTVDAWREALVRQRPHNVEHRVRKHDGTYQWFSTRAVPILDSAGHTARWFGTNTNIESFKRLEAELRHARDLLVLGVRGSKVSIFEFDMPDGDITSARATMINLWESLGYDPATAPSDFAAVTEVIIHADDLSLLRAEVRLYLDGERPDFEAEYRVMRSDGSVLWHLARGVAFRDSEGKPTRFIGSFVEITDRKEIEKRLRASEHLWRSFAETVPQIVFTTIADGTADYFSGRTSTYTGLTQTELLGWGWEAAIHPDDREHTTKTWLENVAHRRPHEVEHRIRSEKGEYRWFITRAALLLDGDDNIAGWFGTCTDIQTVKQLQAELGQAKERLELAIRSAKLCIWEYDMPDGRLESSRESLTNVWESFGYDLNEAPASVAAVIHPEDLPGVGKQILACLSGETRAFEAEHRVRHRDGSYHWILGRGVALRDTEGRPVRFVGTSVDINNIKRIESDLLRAREAAESANRAKDEFLANVSHEIRTPMNAILGMTELALDSARTEHQRQLLSTVRTAARNLLNIINDLLDFSKIAAGKLALDEADFSVRGTLSDTVRALAPRAHRKGLDLKLRVSSDVPDALFGDAGRLRQVLMNLVGNALKFTAQGEVVVAVELHSQAEGWILLSFAVRDTGIGIAREKQTAIFRAFEQEDASTTRKYGGTGLGLTISSQLVALMDGEISVQSEPGQGSTFGFTARFRLSSRVEAEAAVPSQLLEDLRVLVVDDNETNRQVLVDRLTEWRMRPLAVGHAAAAVDALTRAEAQGAPFALVLLDARMPDLDGLTLAAEIQALFGSSSQRLILLSSDDDPVLPARSREAGIGAYLLKPVQHSELLETIWAVMNSPTESAPYRGGGAISPASSSPVRPVSLRILVAEDNELNVALVRELLTDSGHSAEFANDGRTALTLSTTQTFDLLLLDLHMPEMDGFEVVLAIRDAELTTGRHLPIIALTARSSSRDRERCLAAGMDDFLSKPIEAEALWAAIDRMVLAFPPSRARQSRLIDHRALSRACGGRRPILIKLCEVFQLSLPDHMTRVRSALGDRDLAQLSKAAHMLYGTLAAFSTIAGALALTLEDLAKRDELESCAELVDRLEAMCSELLDDAHLLVEQGHSR